MQILPAIGKDTRGAGLVRAAAFTFLTTILLVAPLEAQKASGPDETGEAFPEAATEAADSVSPESLLPESPGKTGEAKPFLREIAVTARLYEEYLQLVPAAVDVMTADDLGSQRLTHVRDVVDFSSGGNTTAFNEMQERYSLRGISSQTEGSSGDSSVATVVDDVVVTREFMKSQSFFDMKVVEILRGPQGTAFGRNASSGLLHLKTAPPEWGFESGVTAESGSHGTYGVEAFATGALSETVAGRLAVNFDQLGGYTEDTLTGRQLGGARNLALRGSLLFAPTEDVKVSVKAEYNRDDDDDPSPRRGQDCSSVYQGDPSQSSVVGSPEPAWTQFPNWSDSCDPWETAVSRPTRLGDFFLDREIFNLTSKVTWRLSDDLTLTSISAYLDGRSDYLIDTHGGPNNSMFQSTQNDAWQASQEIRVDNQRSVDRLRWLAGVYYLLDSQTRDDQNIFYVDNAASDPQHPSGFRPETRDVKQQNNETAALGLYGEIGFDLTDRLNFTVGGRYSHDEKDYSVAHYGWGWGGPLAGLTNGVDADGDGVFDEQCVFAPGGPPDFGLRFCGSPEDPVGFETPVPARASWDNVSLKGSLSYRVDDHRMVYGLVSQGYKTGGFQSEPFNPFDARIPFDEETVINYEVGYRATYRDRFRMNTFLFASKYEDLQLFLFVNTPTGEYSQVTANAADADVRGVEVDYAWEITDRLRLSGTFARIDAELDGAVFDTDGDSVAEDYSGNRPANSPEWTGSAILEYTLPLPDDSSLTLRGDWRGISNVFDSIDEDPARGHDGYDIFGARATWRPAAASWRVSVWGRNLSDEAYTTNVGPANPNLHQLNFAYGPPRTFGVTLSHYMF
jgi:iron complex outermembrane receptor protein